MVDDRLWLPEPYSPPTGPVGRQTPPIFHAPEWDTTLFPVAVKLLEAVGVYLLPWQQLVLRNALANGEDGRWAAFEVCLLVPRQNGKNVIIMALELIHLFLFAPRSREDKKLIVHTAHQFKTARSAFRDIRDVIEAPGNEWLRAKVESITSSTENTSIVAKNGNRLEFVARSGGSGRGLSGDLVILDEAFQLSEDTVGDLLPTLSARTKPQVWYASSTGFDYSVALRKVRDRAVEDPENARRLLLCEWSADVKSLQWDSMEAAQAANPSMGWFQSWDWIREVDLRGMSEESYLRERLGVWADASSDAVIGVDAWRLCELTRDDLLGARIRRRSIALEVSVDRDLVVIGAAAELDDGRVVVEVVAAAAGTAWVQDKVAELMRKHRPWAGLVVDSLSGAASMVGALTQAGVPVSLASTKDLTAGSAEIFDRVTAETPEGDPAPTLLHSPNPWLDDAAHTARKRLVGTSKTAWTWDTSGGVKVEALRAVTLALRGFYMEPVNKRRRRR